MERTCQSIIAEGISFLFVTHNRAPFDNFEHNPLTWSFRSLLTADPYIKEYLVVIDGSEDYTAPNLQWLADTFDLNIRWIDNRERKGCSYRRRQGIGHLRTEYFFMGDDDCVFNEDFVLGTLFYAAYLQSLHSDGAAIIQQPVFDLDVNFSGTTSVKEIGKTYFEDAWFYHNFDKQPESIEGAQFKGVGIVAPLEIETFKGVTFARKSAIVDSGNFIDLSMWPNDYSEHIELSYRMKQKGHRMFYIPDARIACSHIRFGTPSDVWEPNLRSFNFINNKLSLGKMVDISNSFAQATGCRVDDTVFLHTKIGSFFAFYLKLSESTAIKFANMEYEQLVTSAQPFQTDQSSRVMQLTAQERHNLWADAIKMGARVANNQTGNDYAVVLDRLNLEYPRRAKYA